MADASQRPVASAGEPPRLTTEAPFQTGKVSLGKQLLRPRTLLSFLLSFGIIAFVFSRQDIPFAEVRRNIAEANVLFVLLGALCYYGSFYIRAIRWRQVLDNVGYGQKNEARVPRDRELVRIIVLSWFANSILPAKLGDGYRGYLLKRRAEVSFSKTMGTIVAERIADVGVLFFLLLGSGFLAFRDRLPPNFGALVAFGAVLAGLALGSLFFLRFFGPLIARRLPARVRPFYERLEEGVLLAFRRRIGLIALLTACVWGLESARFWFVSASLGVEFGLPLAVFAALSASLLTTVPFTPAGLGVVEGAIVVALVYVGQEKGVAGSIALLDRTITYWGLLLVGAVLYLFTRRK